MILKSLYFDLDRKEYPNDYGYTLLLKSRFYCNYVERTVFKPLKWKTPEFNRIVIRFNNNPSDFYHINSEKVLCVALKFDKSKYETAKSEKIAELFIAYTESVFEEIQKKGIELPVNEVKKANKLFIAENFINKWIFKKSTNRAMNLEATLYCELTEANFILTLQIARKKEVIFEKALLTSDPDPVAYYYNFKNLLFTKDSLIVTSHFPKNLFELDLKDL